MGVRASVWERSADPGWESVLTRPATGSELTVEKRANTRKGSSAAAHNRLHLSFTHPRRSNVSLKRHEAPHADAAS